MAVARRPALRHGRAVYNLTSSSSQWIALSQTLFGVEGPVTNRTAAESAIEGEFALDCSISGGVDVDVSVRPITAVWPRHTAHGCIAPTT